MGVGGVPDMSGPDGPGEKRLFLSAKLNSCKIENTKAVKKE